MTKHLANSTAAYGFGYSMAEALGNFASHARIDPDDTHEVTVVSYEEVKDDAEMSAFPGGYRAEGCEIKTEQTFELDGSDLQEMADLSGELELLVDSTLADADEVDQ